MALFEVFLGLVRKSPALSLASEDQGTLISSAFDFVPTDKITNVMQSEPNDMCPDAVITNTHTHAYSQICLASMEFALWVSLQLPLSCPRSVYCAKLISITTTDTALLH